MTYYDPVQCHDEFMFCRHKLHIRGCQECMATEFKIPELKNPEPIYANVGIQIIVAIYGCDTIQYVIDRAPHWIDWLMSQGGI
jgi:hypothetical protein